MTKETPKPTIYTQLFERGLGELPMLRQVDDTVLLGNLVMDKGALIFRDRGLMRGVTATHVAPCWDLGVIGAIADMAGNDWESLTFVGADHCKIPVNLSSTRHNVLGRSVAASGENLLSFVGSVYRGFKLMLDSNLLPLVLPLQIATQQGVTGLAICDFRFATVPIESLHGINDLVRVAVDRHLTLSVDEVELDDNEFEKMFGQFKAS